MKRFITLFLSFILIFSICFALNAKKKENFTPNLTGAYTGAILGGEGTYSLDYNGKKIEGKTIRELKSVGFGSSYVKQTFDFTVLDKKTTLSLAFDYNMVDMGFGMIKKGVETINGQWGDSSISGQIRKTEFMKVNCEIKIGDKILKGETKYKNFTLDYNGTKIDGKMEGLTNQDLILKIGDKNIVAKIKIDMKLTKNTMNIDYKFKVDDLTDEEVFLLTFLCIFSEVFSGRAS